MKNYGINIRKKRHQQNWTHHFSRKWKLYFYINDARKPINLQLMG